MNNTQNEKDYITEKVKKELAVSRYITAMANATLGTISEEIAFKAYNAYGDERLNSVSTFLEDQASLRNSYIMATMVLEDETRVFLKRATEFLDNYTLSNGQKLRSNEKDEIISETLNTLMKSDYNEMIKSGHYGLPNLKRYGFDDSGLAKLPGLEQLALAMGHYQSTAAFNKIAENNIKAFKNSNSEVKLEIAQVWNNNRSRNKDVYTEFDQNGYATNVSNPILFKTLLQRSQFKKAIAKDEEARQVDVMKSIVDKTFASTIGKEMTPLSQEDVKAQEFMQAYSDFEKLKYDPKTGATLLGDGDSFIIIKKDGDEIKGYSYAFSSGMSINFSGKSDGEISQNIITSEDSSPEEKTAAEESFLGQFPEFNESIVNNQKRFNSEQKMAINLGTIVENVKEYISSKEGEEKILSPSTTPVTIPITPTGGVPGGSLGTYSPTVSKVAPEFFRIKGDKGEPDRLFDAKTNQHISSPEDFKKNYEDKGAKEVNIPESVKLIYRDGEAIFDARTNTQILNPDDLKDYAGAIEVHKPRDYEAEMKAEAPVGTKADDQKFLTEEQLKSFTDIYKSDDAKTAGQSYAQTISKIGKEEVLGSDRPQRRFVKIIPGEMENGQMKYIEYYLPIFTQEELSKLSLADKEHIELQLRDDFVRKGGNVNDWNNSREKNEFLNDIFTNPASQDEIYRAGEYALRLANTGPENEVSIKNVAGQNVKYNVSEDLFFKHEPSTKEIKEEDKKEDKKDDKKEEGKDDEVVVKPGDAGTSNPWSSNAGLAGAAPEEAPKFIDIDTSKDLTGQAPKSYRRITKGRLGGVE